VALRVALEVLVAALLKMVEEQEALVILPPHHQPKALMAVQLLRAAQKALLVAVAHLLLVQAGQVLVQ
jgi:hypothetical protein